MQLQEDVCDDSLRYFVIVAITGVMSALSDERGASNGEQGRVGQHTTFPYMELSDWGGGAGEVREGDVYCVWNLKASDSLRWCVVF